MSSHITEFATTLVKFMGGALDFTERNGTRRISVDRLAFRAQILDHPGAAEVRNPNPDQSIVTAMNQVEIPVTPSLEKIGRTVGDNRYYEWLQKKWLT